MNTVSCVTIAVLFAGLAGAAPAPTSAPAVTSLDASLAAIEKTVATIERDKVLPADFDLDTPLEAYAKQALETFRATYDGVAAQSQAGSRDVAGAQAALRRFESTAAAHAKRGHALLRRLSDVTRGLRSGAIGLPAEYLHKLDDQEIAALRDFLAPEARARYERVEPRLRLPSAGSARLLPLARPGDAPEQAELRCAAEAWRVHRQGPRSLGQRLADLVVPPAEAALGLGCLAVCEGSLGTACASCVAAGGVAAVALYNGAVEAFNSCNRFRPTPRFLCKAAIVVAFIAALA